MTRSGQFRPAGQDARRGKGGARPGAGRPSKQVIADEARATEIAKEMLARGLAPVIAKMKKLCLGVRRKKWIPFAHYEEMAKTNPKLKRFYWEVEYDTALLRFYIERFVAPARQGIDVHVDSPEKFYQALEEAERLEAERRRASYEAAAIPPPTDPEDNPTKH
jgi:hypothetical protein